MLCCGCPIRTAIPANEAGVLPLHYTRDEIPSAVVATWEGRFNLVTNECNQ